MNTRNYFKVLMHGNGIAAFLLAGLSIYTQQYTNMIAAMINVYFVFHCYYCIKSIDRYQDHNK